MQLRLENNYNYNKSITTNSSYRITINDFTDFSLIDSEYLKKTYIISEKQDL